MGWAEIIQGILNMGKNKQEQNNMQNKNTQQLNLGSSNQPGWLGAMMNNNGNSAA